MLYMTEKKKKIRVPQTPQKPKVLKEKPPKEKPSDTTEREYIYCSGCDTDKKYTDFYRSYGNTKSGYLCFCKQCCIDKCLDENGYFVMNKFKNMLKIVDRPYLYTLVEEVNLNDNPSGAIGLYFKDLGLPQYRTLKNKDSVFSPEETKTTKKTTSKKFALSKEKKEELEEKFGYGYTNEELCLFEKKFNTLKSSYPIKSALHMEALITYCRLRVLEEIATRKGDIALVSKLSDLASKAATQAKLNPNQLTQADLSGGVNGFAEMSKAIEECQDIIPILPKFVEKPQDKVDFTLWCYINYVRKLKGLPDCSYKEIWEFYEERKKEYQQEHDREFLFEDEIEGEPNDG